jgi:hypothetical protein
MTVILISVAVTSYFTFYSFITSIVITTVIAIIIAITAHTTFMHLVAKRLFGRI